MLHNEEERIFDQKKSCFATLCETMWTSQVDALAWLLIHYEHFLTYCKKQADNLMPPHTNKQFRILKF